MSDHSFGFHLVPPSRRFRFGPFQVDSRSGELRKHGIRLRIGQQSLQVLLMLLEHPGEVVLREDIRLKLWPNDTVVEFDHSINGAIQKLRAALGESAGSPIYIETLARRGYRFIGAVDAVPQNGINAASLPPKAEARESPAPPEMAVPRKRLRLAAVPGAAAVLLAVAAFAILRPWARHEPVHSWVFTLGNIGQAVVSPDGSAMLYRTAEGLKLRRRNSMEESLVYSARPISDVPAWSPDGSQVLLAASGAVVRLPLPNGPPVSIAPLPNASRGIAWSSNGTILVTMFSGRLETGDLYLIPPAGGDPARLDMPRLTGGMFFLPEFLPDGENFIFAWDAEGEAEAGIYLARLHGRRIVNGPFLLRKSMTAGRFAPWDGGRLLYIQDDTLYAQKLDVGAAALKGAPVKLVDHVFSAPTWRDPGVSVSRNGVLIWRSGRAALAEMTWFDRRGNALGKSGPVGLPWQMRLSPDERHILFQALSGFGVAEANRSGFLPLPGVTNAPLWIANNSQIIYARRDRDRVRFVERPVEGGPERDLAFIDRIGSPLDVSSDGQAMLYRLGDRIYSIRLGDPRATPQFVTNGYNARFSPDGHWIVYRGNELFVERFPPGGLPIQISPGKGGSPVWRADGKEILYLNESTIYSVQVHMTGGDFHAEQPQPLFDVRKPAGLTADSSPLAVSRDGSRILFAQGMEQEGSQPTFVMTDWTSARGR